MTTITEAVDEINDTFQTYWAANAPAIVSPAPKIVTEAQEKDLNPHPASVQLPWVRFLIRHDPTSRQTSL